MINNTLNYFPTKFILTIVAFPASWKSHCFLNKILLLVKACALHSNQLLKCLSKHLTSIAVYNRIAQRIERIQPYENGMRQKYYIPSVTATLRKEKPTNRIHKQWEKTYKQNHYYYPGSFQSFLLLCEVSSSLW